MVVQMVDLFKIRRVSWFYLTGFVVLPDGFFIGFFPRLTGFLALPFYRYLRTTEKQVLGAWAGAR